MYSMKATFTDTCRTAIEELEISPPAELVDLIEKTKDVERYKDPRYPKGMISDNLYDHLTRLILSADHLELDESVKSAVVRIIWIHDLPETILNDQPAVLKEDMLVQVQDEPAVAKEILSPEDFRKYLL